MTPKRDKSAAVKFDTQVSIYSPPNPDAVGNLDSLGAVSRVAGNWSFVGNDWVGFVVQGTSPGQVGHQAGNVQSVEIKMRRRDDLELGFRFKVLNGPYLNRFLYLESIGYQDSRTREVSVICRLASQ